MQEIFQNQNYGSLFSNLSTVLAKSYCSTSSLYNEDVKSKGMKKKGDRSKPTSPIEDRPVSPNTGRKMQLKKEDISHPMYPSSDCLTTEVANLADIKG